MTRRLVLLFGTLLVAGLFAAPVSAQQPTKDELIKALTPTAKTRSFRGVTVEGDDKPPSFDLHVPFDYNSDKLKPDAILILRRLGEALKDPKLSGYRFRLAGHTDARGTAAYNQQLSERRAGAVRDYLIFQYDLDPKRIESIGYGKSQLADPAHPDDAINRRVQVTNIGATQ